MVLEEHRLGEYAEIQVGFAFSSKDFIEKGLPLIRISNVREPLDLSESPRLDAAFASSHAAYLARINDVLVSMSGTIGRTASVKAEHTPSLINQRVGRFVITDAERLDDEYLRHLVKTDRFVRHATLCAYGNAQLNVSPSDLRAFKGFIPPLAEQRRIAEILSTWDRAIELTEKQIAAKERRKQALMQRLLTGKVRLPGFDGEWETKRLGDLGTFHKGKSISKSHLRESGLPAILYGELYTTHSIVVRSVRSYVDAEVANESFELQAGDILFPTSGEAADEIGKPAVYLGASPAYAGGDIVVFRPDDSGDPKFLA